MEQRNMEGKTILVTGGNSGIGKATALELACRGARVVIGCRSLERAQGVQQNALSKGYEIKALALDLASFTSIRSFADQFLNEEARLDVLINNAGVMPLKFGLTIDGFESNIGINHLGHFLLTNLLTDRLVSCGPSRVVTVSSVAHKSGKIDFDSFRDERAFSSIKSYAQGKLANLLFSNELARRLSGTGVTSNALHPGVVGTGIARDLPRFIQKVMPLVTLSPEKGAATSLHLACDPVLTDATGGYYQKSTATRPAPQALNQELAARLWQVSEELTGLA